MPEIVTITMNPAVDISAATERVVPIRKNRCGDQRRDPGGGGINVARVITRLGGQCHAVYPAGGSPGTLLHRLLDEEGVLSLPVAVAGDTRENFTVLERSSGRQFRFVLPGTRLKAAEWRAILDRLKGLLGDASHVVASGSLPPGAPVDFYARVARMVRAAGARLVLDSSGDALRRALDEGVFLCKPNLNELQDLTGRRLSRPAAWEAAAAEIVAAGQAEVVTLTLGEAGAFLAARDLRLRAAGIAVEVDSAVGAGDSFLAAMIWQLAKGADLERAFGHGVAAGTAALLSPGTELCRKRDVEKLYPQVRLTPA